MSLQQVNKAAHGRWIDEKLESDGKGSVDFFTEGQLIQVHGGVRPCGGREEFENERTHKRGKIKEFTARSRMRMMTWCAKLSGDSLPLFVTLTYPGKMTAILQCPIKWKRDLDTFGKWLVRYYPKACAIWKLEPQERGAPHYHLMIWGIPFLPHLVLARRWYDIVGSNQPDHLVSGISVERARTKNGVMCYAGKIYLGKSVTAFKGMVGRFWGILGRKRFDVSICYSIQMKAETTRLFRRVARKWLLSKGIRCGHAKTLNIFTRSFDLWARVGQWACDEITSRYAVSAFNTPY